MMVGATLGTVVLLVPEELSARLTGTHLTTLARIAALCVALGAAFLLDDPATRSTPRCRLCAWPATCFGSPRP